MIPSVARMSLVVMLTLGALAMWGCGPQVSGGNTIPPANADTVVLHVEGMT